MSAAFVIFSLLSSRYISKYGPTGVSMSTVWYRSA